MSKTNLGSNQQDINQQGIKAAGAERPVLQEAVGTVKAAQGEHQGAGDMGRSFSSRLRELRRDKALSLRKLGREIGVTANAVLRWEKDKVTPTRGKMLELARFFDVEPAWLAWGIGSRRNRLKPDDLIPQLAKCDDTQLTAISALLDAFYRDPETLAT
jgi:transcriptional regulator with XRE-family HTH domain